MSVWVKVINGIVETVAFDRPGHFVVTLPELSYGEEFDEITLEPVRTFVPDPDYIEAQDEVFAGYVYAGNTFSPPALQVTGAMVNSERDRRISAGCTVSVPGAGSIPLEGDEKSMRNLQGLAFAASLRLGQGDSTTVTVFRDALNVDHALVPAQLIFLWSQGAAYISALYTASWAIKALIPIPLDYRQDNHWPAYE